MKSISLLLSIFFLSSLVAAPSVYQFPYTREVFQKLNSMPADSIPGMSRFRSAENFYFNYTDDTECRIIKGSGIVRKMSDYLEALNELENGTYDLRLFASQMYQVIGESDYLMCERQLPLAEAKRIDTFFFARVGDYRLWMTEVVNE